MPKLDRAPDAWGRFVATSIRTQAVLRKALRRTVTVGRDSEAGRHLRVLVMGPAASGKSTVLAVVRRLAGSLAIPEAGLELIDDAEILRPSKARVTWQVAQGDPDQVRAWARVQLDMRPGPRAELVQILTKEPKEPSLEIASEFALIDVLTWAMEGVHG